MNFIIISHPLEKKLFKILELEYSAVADLFASGSVWAPETRFAEEVIEEFAAFPAGEHDDLVDSSTQALLRFRQGGFVSLHTDEEDDFDPHGRVANYY